MPSRLPRTASDGFPQPVLSCMRGSDGTSWTGSRTSSTTARTHLAYSSSRAFTWRGGRSIRWTGCVANKRIDTDKPRPAFWLSEV